MSAIPTNDFGIYIERAKKMYGKMAMVNQIMDEESELSKD